MGILLIINLIVLGYFISRKLIKYENLIFALASSFVIGSLLGITVMYLIDVFIAKTFGFYNTANIYNAILTLFSIWLIIKNKEELRALCKKFTLADSIFLGIIFIWSYLSYWMDIGMKAGEIYAYAGWSDQMYHLSYVRSIAVGSNVPTTFPYFANVPISYHFLFNFFCGKVSQAGLNSVVALTLLPALSLTALCALIIELSKKIFKSSKVGWLASILMLFNGSLAIFDWAKNLGHFPTIIDFIKNKAQVTIQNTAVFSFDMFISQRHFALSLAIEILFFLLIYEIFIGKSLGTESCSPPLLRGGGGAEGDDGGVSSAPNKFLFPWRTMLIPLFLMAITPFWNPSVFMVCGMMLAMIGLYFIFKRDWQKVLLLLITGIVALALILPQIYFYQKAGTSFSDYPKYNTHVWAGSLWGTVWFWIKAHGLKLLFFIITLFIVPRKDMKFALFSLLPLLVANLLQFGLYGFDNNKIIWGGYILVCIYASFALLWLCKKLIPVLPSPEAASPSSRWSIWLARAIIGILALMMTLSGIGDYFARVVNQRHATFAYKTSETRLWVEKNTPKTSLFLTAHELLYGDSAATQVTMAGRMLYSVRNCTWTSVNTKERENFTRAFYEGKIPLDEAKLQLAERGIDYILIDAGVREKYEKDNEFLMNFEKVYENAKQEAIILAVPK